MAGDNNVIVTLMKSKVGKLAVVWHERFTTDPELMWWRAGLAISRPLSLKASSESRWKYTRQQLWRKVFFLILLKFQFTATFLDLALLAVHLTLLVFNW